MATAVKTAKRVKPDFSGVVGELLTSDLGLPLIWGNKLRVSPYDAQLDQLVEATETAKKQGKPQPVLKFGQLKARASLCVRARKKNLRISIAEYGGALYVRVDGHLDDKIRETRRLRILGALKQFGVQSATAISVKLREEGDTAADGGIVNAILGQMLKSGDVIQQEGGLWRLAVGKPRLGAA